MQEYLNLFIDEEYPMFIDKYLDTKTLQRLKYITQFCGCDYTKLYSPLFLYTRFNHSLVVAHMTWHFSHDKKQTIVALLHDAGTPCFAHCIDYVFGDYLNQESSEKNIVDLIKQDSEIQKYLKDDGLTLEDLSNFDSYCILENKSPRLCTDRLDGVLHTCYIWLHTHSLEDIKKVYDNIIVLKNEDNNLEIGFKNSETANLFVDMVYNYAKELQGNVDKYVMKYVSELVKIACSNNLITLEDLYTKKEKEICDIFSHNFKSWINFKNATDLKCVDVLPKNNFYISLETKKRNTVPLVMCENENKRVTEVSDYANNIYANLNLYRDTTYAYLEEIEIID